MIVYTCGWCCAWIVFLSVCWFGGGGICEVDSTFSVVCTGGDVDWSMVKTQDARVLLSQCRPLIAFVACASHASLQYCCTMHIVILLPTQVLPVNTPGSQHATRLDMAKEVCYKRLDTVSWSMLFFRPDPYCAPHQRRYVFHASLPGNVIYILTTQRICLNDRSYVFIRR